MTVHRFKRSIYWIGGANSPGKYFPVAVAARKAGIFDLTGCWDKAEKLYSRNLEVSAEAGSKYWEAESHYCLGKVMRYKGRFADSLVHLKRAEELFLQFDDQRGAVMAVGVRGGVFAEQGDYPAAIECFERKKEWAEQNGDLMELADSWGSLGVVHTEKRMISDALDCFQKQLAIARQIGDLQGLSIVNGNIGNIYLFQNCLEAAAEYYSKQKDLAELIGDKRSLCVVSCNLGLLYKYQGQQEKALDRFLNGLKPAQEIGFTRAISSITGNLGTIYQNMGQWEKARVNLMQQLEISQAINDLQGLVTANANLNTLEWLTGNTGKAWEHINSAISLSERHGFDDKLVICLNIAAGQKLMRRIAVEAEKYAAKALDLSKKRDDKEETARASMIIASARVLSGDMGGMVELSRYAAGELGDELKYESQAMLYLCTGRREYLAKAKSLSETLYQKTKDIAFRINYSNLEAMTQP
jgi:tetratricopeptide (TPR) repeat protein